MARYSLRIHPCPTRQAQLSTRAGSRCALLLGERVVHRPDRDADRSCDSADRLALFALRPDPSTPAVVDHDRSAANMTTSARCLQTALDPLAEESAVKGGDVSAVVQEERSLGVIAGGHAFEDLDGNSPFEQVVQRVQALQRAPREVLGVGDDDVSPGAEGSARLGAGAGS
jgi:hypothetical protein